MSVKSGWMAGQVQCTGTILSINQNIKRVDCCRKNSRLVLESSRQLTPPIPVKSGSFAMIVPANTAKRNRKQE